MGKRLKRIIVQVPERFLERFDSEIEGFYASRNEAVRAGMIMLLESLRSESRPERLSVVERARIR
jgi:metal-responsive CopG/Arc/MetJ family transcriptional regulator